MESIAVTRSDMGVLSQEQLTQATFGALCQSFAMQILSRGKYEDGMYQRVALEFLEEDAGESAQPVQNIFNVDLSLVLETIRKEASEQKQLRKQTEKLLEQVLQYRRETERITLEKHISTAEKYYLLQPQQVHISKQYFGVQANVISPGNGVPGVLARRAGETVAGKLREHQQLRQQAREGRRSINDAAATHANGAGDVHTPVVAPSGAGLPGETGSRAAAFAQTRRQEADVLQPRAEKPMSRELFAPTGPDFMRSAPLGAAEIEYRVEGNQTRGQQTAESASALYTAAAKAAEQSVIHALKEETDRNTKKNKQLKSESALQQNEKHLNLKSTPQPEMLRQADDHRSKTSAFEQKIPEGKISVRQEIADPERAANDQNKAVQTADAQKGGATVQAHPVDVSKQKRKNAVSAVPFARSEVNTPHAQANQSITSAADIRLISEEKQPSALRLDRDATAQQSTGYDGRNREELTFREEVGKADDTVFRASGVERQRAAVSSLEKSAVSEHKALKEHEVRADQRRIWEKGSPKGSAERAPSPVHSDGLRNISLTANRGVMPNPAFRDIRTVSQEGKLRVERQPQRSTGADVGRSSGAHPRLSRAQVLARIAQTAPTLLTESQRQELLGYLSGQISEKIESEKETTFTGDSARTTAKPSLKKVQFANHVTNKNDRDYTPVVQSPALPAQQTSGVFSEQKQLPVSSKMEGNLQILTREQREELVKTIPGVSKETTEKTISTISEKQVKYPELQRDIRVLREEQPGEVRTQLERLFGSGLTEADLQFLTEEQREELVKAIPVVSKETTEKPIPTVSEKQVKYPELQRDIRVLREEQPGEVRTQLERLFGAGFTEADLQFLTEEQREELVKTIPVVSEETTEKIIRSVSEKQVTYPELQRDIRVLREEQPGKVRTQLERLFGAGFTEADLQFLTEEQREELVKAIPVVSEETTEKTIPTVSEKQVTYPELQRDIRVLREEQPGGVRTQLEQLFGAGFTEADLQFLTEEQREELVKTIPVVSEETTEKIIRSVSEKQVTYPELQRDIRVLREEQPGGVRTQLEQLFGAGLTEEDLQFLTEEQREELAKTIPVVSKETTEKTVPSVSEKQVTYPELQRDIRVLREEQLGEVHPQLERLFGAGLTEEDLQFLTDERREEIFSTSRKENLYNTTSVQGSNFTSDSPVYRQIIQEIAAEELLLHRENEAVSQQTQKQEMSTKQPVSRSENPSLSPFTSADIRTIRRFARPSAVSRENDSAVFANSPQSAATHAAPAMELYGSEPVEMHLPVTEGGEQGRTPVPLPGQSLPAVETKQRTVYEMNRVPEQVDLTLAPAFQYRQNDTPPPDPGAAKPQPVTGYGSTLPDWAQNFLKNGPAPSAGVTGIRTTGGITSSARPINTLSAAQAEEGMMDWTAPAMSRAMADTRRQADITLKEPKKEENDVRPSGQLSESELRRTADKIYHMIEERIRRERRLLGL